MTDYSPERVEEFEHAVRREWYADGQILVIYMNQQSQASITMWGKAFLEIIENWDQTRPMCTIAVFAGSALTMPVSAREVGAQLLEGSKRMAHSYSAVVVEDQFSAQMANIIASGLTLRTRTRGHEIRVFSKLSAALDWQMKNLAKHD